MKTKYCTMLVFLGKLATAVVVVPVIRELNETECRDDALCAGTAPELHLNPGIMFVSDDQAAAVGAAGLTDSVVSFDGGWSPSVPHGPDQMDQRKPTPDGQPLDFLRDGTGVVLYSLDTGVNCNSMGSKYDTCEVLPLDLASHAVGPGDPHGHGTAMALIAATLARNATLIGIPVLGADGFGKLSDVLLGLKLVVDLHNGSAVPGVVLAPLSSDAMGPRDFQVVDGASGIALLLDQAVRELLGQNVVTVVSAGNDGIDACSVVPASSSAAVTVAGMKVSSRRAGFSNWGPCANVFAPGTGDAAKQTYSGTSVSAAYAAGAATSIASVPGLTARQVRRVLLNNASRYRINDARGTPERFVYVPRRKKARSTAHIERYKAVAITVVGVAVAAAAGLAICRDAHRHGYSLLPP